MTRTRMWRRREELGGKTGTRSAPLAMLPRAFFISTVDRRKHSLAPVIEVLEAHDTRTAS